jgi:hypothetical protein
VVFFINYLFFAVLAERTKFALVGAPLAPGFLIFSPEPAAMRFLLAWMLAYKPRLLAILLASFFHAPFTGAFAFVCHYFFLPRIFFCTDLGSFDIPLFIVFFLTPLPLLFDLVFP